MSRALHLVGLILAPALLLAQETDLAAQVPARVGADGGGPLRGGGPGLPRSDEGRARQPGPPPQPRDGAPPLRPGPRGGRPARGRAERAARRVPGRAVPRRGAHGPGPAGGSRLSPADGAPAPAREPRGAGHARRRAALPRPPRGSRAAPLPPRDRRALRPRAWFALGKTCETLAGRAFEDLLEGDPESPFALALAAEARARSERHAAAFHLYRQATRAGPGDARPARGGGRDLPGHRPPRLGRGRGAQGERPAEARLRTRRARVRLPRREAPGRRSPPRRRRRRRRRPTGGPGRTPSWPPRPSPGSSPSRRPRGPTSGRRRTCARRAATRSRRRSGGRRSPSPRTSPG
jgi:hypothetical protein